MWQRITNKKARVGATWMFMGVITLGLVSLLFPRWWGVTFPSALYEVLVVDARGLPLEGASVRIVAQPELWSGYPFGDRTAKGTMHTGADGSVTFVQPVYPSLRMNGYQRKLFWLIPIAGESRPQFLLEVTHESLGRRVVDLEECFDKAIQDSIQGIVATGRQSRGVDSVYYTYTIRGMPMDVPMETALRSYEYVLRFHKE
jgi:hypothetical protein